LSDALALRSFEEIRALKRPGIAIAAMIAMIAMTIISSIRVNPDRPSFLNLRSLVVKVPRPCGRGIPC
jgi:hypothetical protein